MFDDEFKFEDDTFEVCDKDSKECGCEIKEKLSEIDKNLNSLNIFFDEVDGFAAKQVELFGTLSAKFPNISQFSTALHEAKELSSNVEKSKVFSLSSLDELEDIKEILKQKKDEKQNQNEVNEVISKLFLHIQDLANDKDALEDLKDIISRLN